MISRIPSLVLVFLLVAAAIVPRAEATFTVSGRRLLRDGHVFEVQGVCYHPVPIGTTATTTPAWGDYCTGTFADLHARDLPLLRALGANTVRVYGWDPDVAHAEFLDACTNNGDRPLTVLVNLWIDPATDWSDSTAVASLATRFAALETSLAGHPAVLAVLLGNETDTSNSNSAKPAYWAALDTIAAAIKAVNPARLVSIPITDNLAAVPTAEPLLAHIDFWSLQLYRGTSFGSFFTDFAARSNRPVVLTEFGLDAYDHANTREYPNAAAFPAQTVAGLWAEILGAAETCAGGCVFEFSDDWTKIAGATTHESGGTAHPALPDGYLDEEWFGLYTVAPATTGPDRLTARTLASRLAQMWNAPGIALVQPPASTSVTTGRSAILTVQAVSLQPLHYEWLHEGNALAGTDTAALTIANAQSVHAGAYTVRISNSAGTITAGPATLAVLAPAASQTVTKGHGLTLYAGTGGSFQWQIESGASTWNDLADNATYSGTTTGTLTIANFTTSTRFRCLSTNGNTVTTGAAIAVTVAAALLPYPTGIAADSAGALTVSDSSNNNLQTISATSVVRPLAGATGTAGSADGNGSAARFNAPAGLARSAAGTLYVADSGNATIRRVATDGTVTTFAGSATTRGNADGAAATFNNPAAVALDAAGDLYIADSVNHTIRKITAAGNTATIAGAAGTSGGTDGPALAARFNSPGGLAVDATGNLYISDTGNSTIRLLTPAGAVSTFAGVEGAVGSADGSGSAALFNHPRGLAVDSSGNIYVADTGNSAIRRISPAGAVTTLAGLPTVSGLRNGSGFEAWFDQPQALALDSVGNLYVADTGNATIRKITTIGVVTTLALTAAPANGGSADSPSNGGSSSGGSPATSGGGGGGAVGLHFAIPLLALLALRRRPEPRPAI
ncbi:MAG TPA: hypothetical protein VK178_14855 [Opitutaceae bacterium]|nr:hypothetical protein [Opitutaceae bacterium]